MVVLAYRLKCTLIWSVCDITFGIEIIRNRKFSTKWVGLCGLVVRVSGYRYRGPWFDPRRYQIF